MTDKPVLAELHFTGTIIEWRGPAPFLFVPVPEDQLPELHYAAKQASYGWGVVPVEATINGADFTTSLFPRGDTYYLPVKVAVQRATAVGLGDKVDVTIIVRER